jgi:ribosome-associated protein
VRNEPKRTNRRTKRAEGPAPSAALAAEIEQNRELAKATVEAALDKKALLPVLLDLTGFSTYADFLVIVSGRSDRHVGAVADSVVETLSKRGLKPLGVEGSAGGQWVLIDFGSVVVHVFYHPLREFYDLEGLWLDAPKLPLEVPAEAMVPPQEAY